MDAPERPASAPLVHVGLLLVAGAFAYAGYAFGTDIASALRERDLARLQLDRNGLAFALIAASIAAGIAIAAFGWYGARPSGSAGFGEGPVDPSQDPFNDHAGSRDRWMAGIVLVGALAYVAFQYLPQLTALIDSLTHRGAAQRADATSSPAVTQAPVAKPTPAPTSPRGSRPYPASEHWLPMFQRASTARAAGRPAEAVKEYEAALAVIESRVGADHPLAAAMLERIGEVHIQARQYPAAEPVLRRSLAILEAHSLAEVEAEAGRLILGFDRESVQRKLAWSLWELRRYPDALAAYQRAYDLVADLPIDAADRNRRLAYSSAGIMAAACTQRDWGRADRAMAELKERLPRTAQSDRQWLEYWVRSGEPRLAARQC